MLVHKVSLSGELPYNWIQWFVISHCDILYNRQSRHLDTDDDPCHSSFADIWELILYGIYSFMVLCSATKLGYT
jgi:hypothetical protein